MVIPTLSALVAVALIAVLVLEIRKLRRQVRWLETRIDMMLHPENYPPQHPRCRCMGGGPEFETDRGRSQ